MKFQIRAALLYMSHELYCPGCKISQSPDEPQGYAYARSPSNAHLGQGFDLAERDSSHVTLIALLTVRIS